MHLRLHNPATLISVANAMHQQAFSPRRPLLAWKFRFLSDWGAILRTSYIVTSSCTMLHPIARCVFRSRVGASPQPFKSRPFRACAATLAPSLKPKLRDYQQECIRSVLSSLRRGHKRVGISLATGSGKTVTILHVSRMRMRVS